MQDRIDIIKILQDDKASFFCLMDIDDFNEYNLKHSYENGNKILLAIVEIAKNKLEYRSFIRHSSDEFLFSLNKENLESNNLFYFLNNVKSKLKITVSAGVIKNRREMRVKHKFILLQNALVNAKQNGKNKILVI